MYLFIKRIADIFFAALALLLLLPVFVVIAFLLRFSGEGEIFYRQERVGKSGEVFGILKFATMLKDSANMGHGTLTVRNDPRITIVGKWLRLTKINELPQFWNVLVGDMSFVGPRPLTIKGMARFNEQELKRIHQLQPGITGIGSLVFRDEEKLVTLYKDLGNDPREYYTNYINPYKVKLEMWYFENQTFTVDFLIILTTLYSIITNNRKIAFKTFNNLPPLPKSLTLEHFN
jgi:lipopolysaccharide/colanic/teichoic acid biosynthesis glycosyltransferase